MKNERINKKRYKIITYFCVFLLVVVSGVGLALGKAQNKVKAGVIVEQSFYILPQSINSYINNSNYLTRYLGISNVTLSPSYSSGVWGQVVAQVYEGTTLVGRIQLRAVDGLVGDYVTVQPGQIRLALLYNNSSGNIPYYGERYFVADIVTTTDNNVYFIPHLEQMFEHFNTNSSNFEVRFTYYSRTFEAGNTIKSAQNIFDLPENALTLLYINDVSGLNTSASRDEVTINWGYINSNDNTIYAEHAPTISAQNMQTDDKIIRLGVPLNAAGDAMNFYDISQQALLNISSLPEGSATAQAHIYGVYVWHNSNNIKWGLAEFNTQVDPVPGSALNMNYITSLTELYDFQTLDTMNMTCRLSVSSNFNFITIKNQTNGPDKDSINAVIQQGGFLPAWSVYNWARGTYSGFIAGDASARADYLEGRPGYEAIYQAGYSDGFKYAELGTANWFITSFKAVDAFLSIHIFPNITFGVLLGIPFVISVAWFIIRMFRGGGSE